MKEELRRTHCLRQAQGEDEWQQAQPVTVKLATGAVDFADNGGGASHDDSEQDAADGQQHDVDRGGVRGGKRRTNVEHQRLPVTMFKDVRR